LTPAHPMSWIGPVRSGSPGCVPSDHLLRKIDRFG